MKRFLLLLLVLMLVLFSCTYYPIQRPTTIEPIETLEIEKQDVHTIKDVQWYKDEVFRITNLEREKHGVPIFKKGDQQLDRAANLRALEIVTRFEHKRLDGRDIKTVFTDVGIVDWKVVAENLAANSVQHHEPQDTVNQWLNSEGHRIAMLHPDYDYMSVGYTEKNGRAYIVQLFLSKFE